MNKSRRIAGLLIGICLPLTALAPAAARAGDAASARLAATLAAAEAHDGRTSPLLLPVIDRLAEAQQRDGALDAAAALRRRALAIAIAAFGCESANAAAAMTALAWLDIDRIRYIDSEPLLIIAERILRGQEAPDQQLLATVDAGLARIALARGEAKRAEAWARDATGIAEHDRGPALSVALGTLGAVLTKERRFPEAERILREALARDRAAGDRLATARSLARLGNLFLRKNRAEKALPPLERAAAIDQSRLGPNHPFIADDLHDLGVAYMALKRNREAALAFLAALDVLQRGSERRTPRVAYVELELARLYRQRGDTHAAEAAFKRARQILNKAEAEMHRRQRRV